MRILLARRAFSAVAFVIALSVPGAGDAAPTSEPLAEVNGETITAAEIEQALGAQVRRLEQQIYEMKHQRLEAVIGERLLALEAARQGLAVQALLDAEGTAKAEPVTDEEGERFYQANRAQMKGDEVEARERIRAYFKSQKLVARRQAYMRALRSQATVVVRLQEPAAFRAEVGVEGAPFRGPAAAPVTNGTFSDFHCAFCKRVVPTLTQILSRYADKVKLVYRDFPMDVLHPQARNAAEAARCAHDQGKFWEYHDALFAHAPKAGPELRTHAQQVGLDLPSFERCLASGTHAATVQKSVDEAIRLGVTGTPAFFVNGELLSGAQPLEELTRVIERELARGR